MLLLNDVPVKYFTFSGGEIQVKLPTNIKQERAILTWKPKSPESPMILALTVNALQHMGITDIDLDILYLPYARQDRVCAKGEAFSLEVIMNLIDSMNLSVIRIYDPHSELDYHSGVIIHTIKDIFVRYKLLEHNSMANIILCAPDIGARWKIDNIVNHYEIKAAIHCVKERNPEDGKIITTHLESYHRDITDKDIFVIDDICDGGQTFINTAELLKSKGAKDIYLYVTHGIFSKGFTELLKYYRHIYCHHVLHDTIYQSTADLTILREFKYEH